MVGEWRDVGANLKGPSSQPKQNGNAFVVGGGGGWWGGWVEVGGAQADVEEHAVALEVHGPLP